jgi:hypothetical protein
MLLYVFSKLKTTWRSLFIFLYLCIRYLCKKISFVVDHPDMNRSQFFNTVVLHFNLCSIALFQSLMLRLKLNLAIICGALVSPLFLYIGIKVFFPSL